MLTKEFVGYHYLKERMKSEHGKSLLRTKLTIFTVFYVGTVLELMFRLRMQSYFNIEPELPSQLNFSSQIDVSYPAVKRDRFTPRMENSPTTLIQASACLLIFWVNMHFWLSRETFHAGKHFFNFIVASLCITGLIPPASVRSISDTKFMFLNTTLAIYQVVLTCSTALTFSHVVIANALMAAYMVPNMTHWFCVTLNPPWCFWDAYFYMITPFVLVLLMGY